MKKISIIIVSFPILIGISSCILETKIPFFDSESNVVVFKDIELIKKSPPDAMFLRLSSKNQKVFKFYVGFLDKGRGMMGVIYCNEKKFNLINFLYIENKNRYFHVKEEFFLFNNYWIGFRWIKILFDKPIIKNTLPETIYFAACTMPIA